jgi:dihydroflavonol-4-reductase
VRTALVTGATGFVGGHVARALLAAGWNVRAMVRPRSVPDARWPEPCEVALADLRDAEDVVRAARGTDAVFHVAAEYSLARRRGREVHRANVEGTANAIAAARAADVPLVHTSSVATIGIPGDGRVGDEDTPLAPADAIGAYKRSKVDAERLVLRAAAAGQWAVVVNPTAPVGPGDWRPTPTGRVIRDGARGAMPAFVDTGLNLVDVRDVAAGHLLALERGVSGRRYILGAENLSLAEILRLAARLGGRRPPLRRLPHRLAIGISAADEVLEGWLLGREPRAPLDGALMARKSMFVTADRAVRELGLPQSPVREALADAVDWFLGRPPRTAPDPAPAAAPAP